MAYDPWSDETLADPEVRAVLVALVALWVQRHPEAAAYARGQKAGLNAFLWLAEEAFEQVVP